MSIRKPRSTRPAPGQKSLAKQAAQEILLAAENGEKIFSVSVFLDLLNTGLKDFTVKIRGEISSATERGGHWYFDLKDKTDGSVISCLIWRSNYRLSGVNLKEGLEIVAHGCPSVYKPNGRLSFQADTIELMGEGALKKQYEELKAKLAADGLFAPERKRTVPLFPEKIGLITSRQGEAIFDFRTNLGKFGLQIYFKDSRVEGTQAVPGLLRALDYFKTKDIDVLVLVRGGGSLESLLSFNNEALARAVAAFPKPVVTGIGHEQDVSLVDLVADRSCSTPTGAAKLLSYSWEQALARVNLSAQELFARFGENLNQIRLALNRTATYLNQHLHLILDQVRRWEEKIKSRYVLLGQALKQMSQELNYGQQNLLSAFRRQQDAVVMMLKNAETTIKTGDPARLLSLGFSLVFTNGRLLKSVRQVEDGEVLEVKLQDGVIHAKTQTK